MSLFKKQELKVGQLWLRTSTIEVYQDKDIDEVLEISENFVRYKRGDSGGIDLIVPIKDFYSIRKLYKDCP